MQGYLEGGTGTDSALHRHRSTVRLRHMLDNTETDTSASLLPFAGSRSPIKSFKDARNLIRGNTRALIGDAQHKSAFPPRQADPYLATR